MANPLTDHRLSGAPPWYVEQYEPDLEAPFPLVGFITKNEPSPFPGPNHKPPRQMKGGKFFPFLGVALVVFLLLGRIGLPGSTIEVGGRGLHRARYDGRNGRYQYLGETDPAPLVTETIVPAPTPTWPRPTRPPGEPQWRRQADGSLVFTFPDQANTNHDSNTFDLGQLPTPEPFGFGRITLPTPSPFGLGDLVPQPSLNPDPMGLDDQ